MSFKRSVKKAHCRRSRNSDSVTVDELRLGRLHSCGLGTEHFLTDLLRKVGVQLNEVKKAHCRRSRNSFLQTFVLSLFVAVLTSCNLNLGEKPPVTKVGQFAGGKCLTQATPTIKKFLDGEASQGEVANTWDCIIDAMSKFRKYVRGKVADRYSAQEFSTFLENNFLDEGSRIQPSLQFEFMKIKQIFIGGAVDSITLKEIDRSLAVFSTFKNMSLRVNPYMKILTLKWNLEHQSINNNDLIYFEEANEVVQETSFSLSSLIQMNHLGYHLDDFVTLLDQLAAFNGENWESVREIERFMPVVKKVKKAVAGGDEENVMSGEWRSFVSLGVRGYIQYLRYYYFIRSAPQTGMAIKLSYIAKSIEDALSIFQDLVATKPSGVVSKGEVSDILFTFSDVWPEFKVSELLIDEFMKIKQLVFGGSLNEWNRDDFALARLKVVKLKAIVERFLPYYAIYGMDWDRYDMPREEQRVFFNESQVSLENSAKEFGILLETAYDLKNLVIITGELERLYDKNQTYRLTNELKNYLPLLSEFKQQIYLDEGSFVTRDKWPHFLGLSAKLYSAYLYHYFFVKGQSWEKSDTLLDMKLLVGQVHQLFSFVFNSKEGNPWLTIAEVQTLAHRMIDAGILDKNVKYDSIDSMVTALLKHILVDPSLRNQSSFHLNQDKINLIQSEALNYFDAELFFIDSLQDKKEISNEELVTLLQKKRREFGLTTRQKNLFDEFLNVTQSVYPFAVDEKLRLKIGKDKNPNHSWQSLDQLNFNRLIARMFLRGFASDIEKGLTLDEGIYAYSLLKPYYVDIDVLDKNNQTFPNSRFRDGNMFTPRANGDSYLSFLEGVDLVGLIWSGIKISNDLKTDLFGKCVPVGSELGSSTQISVSCAHQVFSQSMKFKMNSMPGFVQYMKVAQNSNDAYDWNFYLNNIFKSAGYIPNRQQLANYGDIGLVPHLIQYVELLYSKFDKNYDGFLNAAEAVKAFPCFSGIIREMAKAELQDGTLKEKHLIPLFTYILRYGKPPETMKEKLRFRFFWRDKPEKWDVWADRTQIAKILGYIADQTAKSNK